MHLRRSFITFIGFFGFGFVCLCLVGGCSDDSKTTGTQVQLSEEAKAQIKDMRDMYKEAKVPRRTGRGKKDDD